jgi:hypothetical protein
MLQPTHLFISSGRPNVVPTKIVLAAIACVLLGTIRAQAQVVSQHENPQFSATVTSVESNPGANGRHYITTSIHFQNLTKEKLILGVERGKVNITDDMHNSYGVLAVRGLGEINGTGLDTNFQLPPGGGGDALFDARWRGDRNAIFGVTFELKLAVRSILSLEGGQYKLGTERVMTFSGLKAGHVSQAKGAASLPKYTVDAGPFTVQITKMTTSTKGRWHVASLPAKIQNTSDKPIILAYVGSSSFGIDDQGHRYGYGVAGTHDTSFSGIGAMTSTTADPQLVLAPGESRDIQLSVICGLGRDSAGTMLTYYVSLAQLDILPSKQVRTVRQYSLTFPRMAGLN